MARQSHIELFLPLHPNPRIVAAARQLLRPGPVQIIDPMEYDTWIAFLKTAHLIISDSGGLQEEASILGIPLLITRDHTERPEVVSGGYGVLAGHDPQRIVALATDILAGRLTFATGSPYGDGQASRRIVSHLLHDLSDRDGSA